MCNFNLYTSNNTSKKWTMDNGKMDTYPETDGLSERKHSPAETLPIGLTDRKAVQKTTVCL